MTTIAEAATSVSTSNVTPPMLNGCGATTAPMTRPAMSSTRPGMKNSQRGLNSSRKRRCRQPSRQVRRCGGRLRPSLASVVGTSVIALLGQGRLDDHLAGELHAGRLQVERDHAVPAEAAQAAVEVADLAAEEQPADEGEHRVAEVAVQRRHRARLDAALEAVAHHQVGALAQLVRRTASGW